MRDQEDTWLNSTMKEDQEETRDFRRKNKRVEKVVILVIARRMEK